MSNTYMIGKCVVAVGVAAVVGRVCRDVYNWFSVRDGYDILDDFGDWLESKSRYQSRAIWDATDFAWSKKLEENYERIAAEFDAYMEKHYVPQFDALDEIQERLNLDRKWKTLWLKVYGGWSKVAEEFPFTVNLLKDTKCSSCMFSVLQPGKVIPVHRGPYKGVIRYHLGLRVNETVSRDKIAIRIFTTRNNNVDYVDLHWRTGKALAFDDTFYHTAWNSSEDPRLILFLDIPRPDLPFFHSVLNNVFLTTISRISDTAQEMIMNINTFHDRKKHEPLPIGGMLQRDRPLENTEQTR